MKAVFRGMIAVLVSLVLAALASVAQAQIAKQGQPRGTASWHGNGTVHDWGEGHMSFFGEYWGVSFGQNGAGLFHNMSWYCTGEATWNSTQALGAGGLCTMTDADGDKIYLRWEDDKPTPVGQFYNRGTYLRGTGKYTGIQGHYLLDGRVIADGNFIGNFVGGEYKLP